MIKQNSCCFLIQVEKQWTSHWFKLLKEIKLILSKATNTWVLYLSAVCLLNYIFPTWPLNLRWSLDFITEINHAFPLEQDNFWFHLPLLGCGDVIYMWASVKHCVLLLAEICRHFTHHCDMYINLNWSALLKMCRWYSLVGANLWSSSWIDTFLLIRINILTEPKTTSSCVSVSSLCMHWAWKKVV